jgi:hypothetical protein
MGRNIDLRWRFREWSVKTRGYITFLSSQISWQYALISYQDRLGWWYVLLFAQKFLLFSFRNFNFLISFIVFIFQKFFLITVKILLRCRIVGLFTLTKPYLTSMQTFLLDNNLFVFVGLILQSILLFEQIYSYGAFLKLTLLSHKLAAD